MVKARSSTGQFKKIEDNSEVSNKFQMDDFGFLYSEIKLKMPKFTLMYKALGKNCQQQGC